MRLIHQAGHSKEDDNLRTAYNTTLDPELIKKIKILAAQMDKRQNDLIEEAIQEFIKKYEHIVPSQRLSDNI